jgi:hypothetical protein
MSNVQNRLENIKRDGYDFRMGEFISQGFTIFGKNAGMFIGFLLVSITISIILSFIPLLGQLVSIVISGAMSAGYFIVAHKTYKNDYSSFSNFFDGFQDLGQLFLNTLIMILIYVIGCIPIIIFFVKNFASGDSSLDFDDPESVADLIRAFGGLYILLYALGIILLSIFVIYTILFIVFDKMTAFNAIGASMTTVSKNIFSHIGFLILWLIILMISAIPIFLGLLVTVPAFYCSIYYAWQEITRYNDNEEEDADGLLNHLID